MEDQKISLMVTDQIEKLPGELSYERILDLLTDPDSPQVCKLLSELSTMSMKED